MIDLVKKLDAGGFTMGEKLTIVTALVKLAELEGRAAQDAGTMWVDCAKQMVAPQ